jgi:nitrogen regulatory protein PII
MATEKIRLIQINENMKAIMIIYNQTHSERVEYLLDKLEIRGYTQWENVKGSGSRSGVPHFGTHVWPEINKSILTLVDDEKVDKVIEAVRKVDAINEEVGIRAFVWDILKSI